MMKVWKSKENDGSKNSGFTAPVANENVALLQVQNPSPAKTVMYPSYNSVSQSNNGGDACDMHVKAPQEFDSPRNGECRTVIEAAEKRWSPSSKLMLLLSGLILAGLMALGSVLPVNMPTNNELVSDILQSELLFAPDVANETTTFQDLAKLMMPPWYQTTLSIMPVFTPTVDPGDVYRARKILLKTRDLLDVLSPVYPNTTTDSNSTKDLWGLTRHYLNQGYTTVGNFQDLHNAHIMYSQQQLEAQRDLVLEWKSEFEQFRASHNYVNDFLASPSPASWRHHESHLYWANAASVPSGTDSATTSLRVLGTKQLHQVLEYLWSAMSIASVMDTEKHGHYHNLRKELRSVVDEYELFGSVMFPDTADVQSSMSVLTRARKLLGDINDDWTCYEFYVEHLEFYDEQTRLARQIDEAWAYFQQWVHESNFEGAVQYLLDSLNPMQPEPMNHVAPSLEEFLKLRKQDPTSHIVIGNEAGDADSIISAVTLSYIESTQEDVESTPIVSIPMVDLASQRPEVKLLLELAGIRQPTSDLIFVDDSFIKDDLKTATVTLVDHNTIEEKFQDRNWTVIEIVDHHCDEGHYLKTCSGSARTIAFAKTKALVASACTLVAERLSNVWTPPYPSAVGVLLLGVILLDSVNLSPEVGKVTQRDRDAVADLLENTDWQELPVESQVKLGVDSSLRPDTNTVFNVLQDAKYDPRFWKSLTVRDALRYDYKDFEVNTYLFGVSTVLMRLEDFFRKHHVVTGVLRYMEEVKVDFLGIMFAFQEERVLFRQLALCGRNGFPLDDVNVFLHQSGYYEHPLELKMIEDYSIPTSNRQLSLLSFDQLNVKPSRKQIGPILVEYFQQSIMSAEDEGFKDS